MKRALTVLFAALLCCLAAGALADSPVYSLYRGTGDSWALSGTAMFCTSDEDVAVFLGAGEVRDGDALLLSGDDGQWPVLSAWRVGSTGALVLYTGPEAGSGLDIAVSRFSPSALTSFDALSVGQDWIWGAPVSVSAAAVDGLDVCLVTLSQDTLPGAVLFTGDDEQALVLTAKYGERPFTWIGMDILSALNALEHESAREVRLADASGAPAEDSEGFVTGFTITADAGMMSIRLPEAAESAEGWRIYSFDLANTYFIYYETSGNSFSVPAVPGHSYAMWLQALPGEVSHSPSLHTPQRFDMPLPGTVDRYGYREEGAWFTWAGREYAPDEEVPLQSPVSLSALQDGAKAYLQVISLYETDREISERLIIALTAPNGSTICEAAGFLYMPGLERDVWNADLTATLTDGAGYLDDPYGTWKVQWFYNGDLAGECEFELAQ